MGEKQFITVGIPTYNSSMYLSKCLDSIKDSKAIDEILISDDGSNLTELIKIKQIVSLYESRYSLNINFFENTTNVGAYKNKLKLIEASKNEYIYVLDSDNLASKNIDKIIYKVFKEKNPELLYQPNIMYQFWRYPRFAKLMSLFDKKYIVKFFTEDSTLDKGDVKSLLLDNSGTYDLNNFKYQQRPLPVAKKKLIDKWVFWILNCGNFIVNKNLMIKVAKQGLNFERKYLSVDAIVFSYLWIESGMKIKLFYDFFHHHRKRNDSVSFKESEDSVTAIKYFIAKVLNF